MLLKQLDLENFRSHINLKLKLDQAVTLIVGGNGSGKTSIIEALFLASTGQSFRAGKADEMITFEQELARIKVATLEDKIEILLTRGLLQGQRTPYKHYRINSVKKRGKDVVGQFQVVVFRPEDLRLVEGSPRRRRAFLDQVSTSFSPEYARSLTTYERTLVRLNKLLQAVRDGEQPQTTLQYWNMSLIKHGEILQNYRRKWLGATQQTKFPVRFSATYLPSLISDERLNEYQPRAIAAGHALIGPHKDDFVVAADVVNINRGQTDQFKDVAIYGSRGQQRLAVLWLKTCQLAYIEQELKETPMLLLDDILSELDSPSRTFTLSLLEGRQSMITTASQGIGERISKTFPKLTKITL
ncbi:MAG: AAA family ATPase [Patescibacteria group bacterium]|nr:AAA family ATPase [Patescibacteria group bacterium]